jgi:hypothetical protein
MRFPHLFETLGGITLVALSLIATPAAAQTVISNETLVSTTFVVNKTSATAECRHTGCRARTSMFAPVPVTCPAASGQTCTFHISLDAKVTTDFYGYEGCCAYGPTGFYQVLVDGAAPTIGPTSPNGDYIFQENVVTNHYARNRQSVTASLIAGVTNSGANSHTISLSLGCQDTPRNGGCRATVHWSTMRVDVFEP